MRRLLAAILIVPAILAAPPAVSPSIAPAAPRTPVVLELFTSEGCSSCPPADRLLESLDHQPVRGADLIVLSEHVDYWNYLGWADPWSSPLFSERQRGYANHLATSVYTPQLVIDGQYSVVGSDRRDVMKMLDQAVNNSKLSMSVRAVNVGGSASVHVDADIGGRNADLYILLAADHSRSEVRKGENGGQTLTHVAVVQSVIGFGKWEGGRTGRDLKVSQKQPLVSGETRAVALLQDPRTGHILGAAQTRLTSSGTD